MANQKEIGIFGLPRSLSKDPAERRSEIWQSINAGYDRVNHRFGKLAANRWQPNSSTVILCDTTSELVERVLDDSAKSSQSQRDNFTREPGLAWTSYTTRRVYFDTSGDLTPAHLAQTTAHETIHAWAGRQPISFQEITAQQLSNEANERTVANLEYWANEGIVDFCACEALGLLKPPVTRLEPTGLLPNVLRVFYVRQLADALRPNTEDILFRISQGKFTATEIEKLNRRMRPSPFDPRKRSFYEYGFLFTLSTFMLASVDEKIANLWLQSNIQDINETLAWIEFALGRYSENLGYLGRDDVVQAKAILVANPLKPRLSD